MKGLLGYFEQVLEYILFKNVHFFLRQIVYHTLPPKEDSHVIFLGVASHHIDVRQLTIWAGAVFCQKKIDPNCNL